MVDFSILQSSQTENTIINPKDLFAVLSRKDKRFPYLRDVQTEVLVNWFSKRESENIIIKMNTGSGKTIVGLLILKSCLNEGKGPAVYVAPDKYLENQVESEAILLGIETTKDPSSLRYLSQKAILIINIYSLFNGMSVFGVGNEGSKIDIGSMVIDDAHACIDKIEEQFTFQIFRKTDDKPDNDKDVYKKLLSLFKDDLTGQSSAQYADIEINVPYSSMQ
jgi:replicative superfamily II helicase